MVKAATRPALIIFTPTLTLPLNGGGLDGVLLMPLIIFEPKGEEDNPAENLFFPTSLKKVAP